MITENVYEVLGRRGFIQQVTDPEPLKELLGSESVTCYVGYDPTADSLHVGHLMTIMGLANMQRHGHRPIALIGGGTAMVGDPSGKTEMRKMLTREMIQENGDRFKKQLSNYLDFSDDKAILIDNYEWLGNLNYVDFLRDIGRHFSVNKMLTYETYKKRLETGLSFLEFNYQLLQAYDFLSLHNRYGCQVQMGGDDQWGNILAGADLTRRIEAHDVYGLTFPLLTTAGGKKMGKTESGALWLDPDKTSPYEYYQYWVNSADSDVARFLSFFTFLPVEEIEAVKKLEGAELNAAKAVLAFEATKLTHGEDEAKSALHSSMAAFGSREIPEDLCPSSTIPRGRVGLDEQGIPSAEKTMSFIREEPVLVEVLVEVGLVSSRGEAKRLIKQGGVYLNEERVDSIDVRIKETDVNDGKIQLRLGKKKHFLLKIS